MWQTHRDDKAEGKKIEKKRDFFIIYIKDKKDKQDVRSKI